MSSPFQLSDADLSRLPRFFPALRFDREEQIRALLFSGTGDFQAVPGSGKTTLLGAKLALMASRWPHERRGICILTHTNVAREEIEGCLRAVPHGETLLAYPHFIGTIQTFVNRFLALPWLRANGIEIREIDDDDFEERFFRRVMADWSAKSWVKRNEYQRSATIRGVRYRGAGLDLVTTADFPLPKTGRCVEQCRRVKLAMLEEGRVRHEDMFAFAEQALAEVAGLSDSLEHRFPNVFIDEMQDTSDTQLDVLTKVFRTASVTQRFGDINQSILSRGTSSSAAAFPMPGSMEVKTSLRFGSAIAGVANSLKPVGDKIDGRGEACVEPPTLLLYSDDTIKEVVGRFGTWLTTLFAPEELSRHTVKAVCAIKREGNAKQQVGRHIRDYFPAYDDTASKPSSARRSVRELLRLAGDPAVSRAEKRSNSAREAVLRMLAEFGRDEVKAAKSWRDLARLLSPGAQAMPRMQNVVLNAVLGGYKLNTEAEASLSIRQIIEDLHTLIEGDPASRPMPADWLEDSGEGFRADGAVSNCLRVSANEQEVAIHLATIASVKGETHLATLVLESCNNRTYDIKSVLPYLCWDASAATVTDYDDRHRLMNMFVAASRPRRLLAFAMHAARTDTATLTKLKAQGWQIFDWTKPCASAPVQGT